MPFPAEPEVTTAAAPCGAIARRRSRYKGARPTRPFTSLEGSPSLAPDQSRQYRDEPSPGRGRHNTAACVVPVDIPDRLKSSPLRRPVDHELSSNSIQPRRSRREGGHSKNAAGNEEVVENSHTKNLEDALGMFPTEHPVEHQPRMGRTTLRAGRSEEQASVKKSLASPKKSLTRRIVEQTGGGHRKDREELKRTISGPIAVQPPQTSVAPAFDAPISAVNAGERRVTVRYGKYTMSLPVTPSTTPIDIICLANEQVFESISPETMIVVESYRQLGLERPLRMYERVRDVLNSWDNDTENTLLIMPSPTGGKDDDLDLGCVSRMQPEGRSVSIYHSQRPGNWDKRWVTLRTDGQVVIAKSDGGETWNICHLSDFDIYVPTARQLSKQIRPPRKTCFTVKSQQKSSMFMSTVNFVHFFSTGDKNLGATWYNAIQAWRSWYLVNVLGEGQEPPQSAQEGMSSVDHTSTDDGRPRTNGRGRPLTANRDRTIQETRESVTHSMPIRSRDAPHPSDLKHLTKKGESLPQKLRIDGPPKTHASTQMNPKPETFATTGLLGRTYTKRQQAQKSREAAKGAGIGLPPILTSTTSHPDGLKRSSSQRPKTKPLVDLTPQYREPPQHLRKGRGVVPEQMPAGGLVEIATSPENAVDIPPATTWKKPTISSGHEVATANMQRSRTVRRNNSGSQPKTARQASSSPAKGDVPFTGGLLAGNSKGQGDVSTGKGVRTGNRQAKAPMLDITQESDYAPGSLLNRV